MEDIDLQALGIRSGAARTWIKQRNGWLRPALGVSPPRGEEGLGQDRLPPLSPLVRVLATPPRRAKSSDFETKNPPKGSLPSPPVPPRIPRVVLRTPVSSQIVTAASVPEVKCTAKATTGTGAGSVSATCASAKNHVELPSPHQRSSQLSRPPPSRPAPPEPLRRREHLSGRTKECTREGDLPRKVRAHCPPVETVTLWTRR